MECRNFREMSKTTIYVSEKEGGLISTRKKFKIHFEKPQKRKKEKAMRYEGSIWALGSQDLFYILAF